MPPPKPWREWNDLAAYQFDNVVLFVGMVIENALQERKKNGDESEPRWSLEELLDPAFRLPGRDASGSRGQSVSIKTIAAANPGTVGRWKEESKATR
jgi:hypothetical protein